LFCSPPAISAPSVRGRVRVDDRPLAAAGANFSFDAVWLGAVPIIGQLILSVALLGGEHPATYRYLIAAAGSMLPALAFVAAAGRLLRREAIVFRS